MAKKTRRAKLKAKLDKLWSLEVRRKYPRCVMCGRSDGLNAHHAIARKAQSDGVRWLVENGISLCYMCHICKLHGQQADKQWLSNYIDIVNQLISKTVQQSIIEISHRVNKFSLEDLEELIAGFELRSKK